MKVAGNGQGKILTPDELRRMFALGLRTSRDRAMFGICLFTGCPLSYALAHKTTDIKRETLTFRKSTTVRQAENPRGRCPVWSGCTKQNINPSQEHCFQGAGSFAYTNLVGS